jgi:hypothetical protein
VVRRSNIVRAIYYDGRPFEQRDMLLERTHRPRIAVVIDESTESARGRRVTCARTGSCG